MHIKFPSQRTRSVLWWTAAIALLAGAWYSFGPKGFFMALTVLCFWLLAQFTRLMNVLRIAASRPKGLVNSCLSLHRVLEPGMRVVEVVRRAHCLGDLTSATNAQPEVFVWRDDKGYALRCEFVDGRLTRRHLDEPEAGEGVAGT